MFNCCVQGVVHTYGSLQSQIVAMQESWSWTSNDVLLHVLPLHHVHGNVNALLTPMWCGACCVMVPTFDPAQVQYIGTLFLTAILVFHVMHWVNCVYRSVLCASV